MKPSVKRVFKLAVVAGEYAVAYPAFYARITPWIVKNKLHEMLTIVFYHEIGGDRDVLGGITVDANVFERHIRFLKSRFNPVRLEQVHSFFEKGDPLPARAALVCFDGGYAGNYDHAWPILRAHDVPAVVYLVAKCIDEQILPWPTRLSCILNTATVRRIVVGSGGGQRSIDLSSSYSRRLAAKELKAGLYSLASDEREAQLSDLVRMLKAVEPSGKKSCLEWHEIREMHRHGLVSFGSHTLTHPRLSDISIEEATREITESKQVIEARIGADVTSFCFPDGRYDQRHLEVVKHIGYKSALTTQNGTNSRVADPFELRRVGAEDHRVPLFAAKITGVLPAFRRAVRHR